jgi:putative redox protein
MTARVQRVTFPGSHGVDLAARLDLPAGPPRSWCLFAHCFTCGKDLRSASRIAAGLTEMGIAVLRFDFTGLGESDGEFENTDFTSDVADVVAAADWLRAEYAAPQLLLGHSLGGAAVIAAADTIPEVRAVATIGAPSSTEHVGSLFEHAVPEIEAAGAAPVTLAGREFCITRSFLDDLERHVVTDRVADLRRALLVLHSPVDQIVSVDHAAALYQAARHPKSFVGLDGADHLLSDPADAAFVARIVGAWADRYVHDQSGLAPPPEPTAQVVVAETNQGTFLNHVVAGEHRFLADEPESVGGFDAGPSPYDLLAAALGTCTSMTIRMYADRKRWPVRRIAVEVSHDKVHGDDASSDRPARLDRFTRVLRVDGDLDDEQRTRLVEIADKCPVHRTLHQSSLIETHLEDDPVTG